MKGRVAAVAVGAVVFAAASASAQDGPKRRSGGGDQGAQLVQVFDAVFTNATLGAIIGFTGEQKAGLPENLDAGKVASVLAARQMAESCKAILTDPGIAADLGLTDEQQAAVNAQMTPALIMKAFSAEQLGALVRALDRATRMGQASYRARLSEHWKRFDTDGDGTLSEEERQAMREAWQKERGGRQLPERYKQFDTDGDGRLSEQEREAARQQKQQGGGQGGQL